MTTGQAPISQLAPWAWTGGREALAIAEEVGWASVTTGDGRGELARQIERVRAGWLRRRAAEWAAD